MRTQDVGSVDEFIAGFYEGARLDSGGVFTVDVNKRMEKLSKFQLRIPENFVLSLMVAATLGGASRFDLHREAGHFLLQFDGQSFSSEEMAGVCHMMMNSAVDSGSRRLQSLGYALLLVANLQHGTIRLVSGGQALLRNGRIWQVEPATEFEMTTLTVQRGRWEFLLPARLSKSYQAIENLLIKRCSYGPAQLNLVTSPVFSDSTPRSALLINSGPPIAWPPPRESLGSLSFPQQPDCRGLILLGGERQEVVLVSAGVAEVLPKPPKANYGYQAILWCDSLKSDLSLENLVRDEVFHRLLKYVVLWILELEMDVVLRQFASLGVAGVLAQPAAQATLWGLRQQLLLALEPLKVDWKRRGAHEIPELDLNSAVSAHLRRHWLPVAEPEEGSFQLEDGTPVFSRTPKIAPFLDLVFPLQREFVHWQGRAVPNKLALSSLQSKEGLFRRQSALMFDAQIGQNWSGPSQSWFYKGGKLVEIADPDPRLPAGHTLIHLGNRSLQDSEFKRLLDSLYQRD